MSRQRSALLAESRRLRGDRYMFQASDSEILSDLKRMKYVKKPDAIQIPEVPQKIELPKKRKAPVEDNNYVIDCLVKLMACKNPEPQQKSKELVVKKPESPQKPIFPQNPVLASYLAFQQNLIRNTYYMSQMNLLNFPVFAYTSSADQHVKLANFIQNSKIMKK